MGGFKKLIKILSKDAHLLENKVLFRDCLGISAAKMGPSFTKFDLMHCTPYELIRIMLSEWITIKKDSATIAELRRILREDGFLTLSDKLEGLEKMHPGPIKIPELEASSRNDPLPHSSGNPPPIEITKRQTTFGMKSVVQNFTGREEELQRLNEYFICKETPIVLVSGLGGIGKTELARKFALDVFDASGNGQIVKCWLSGENPQSLLTSITQFCHHLQLPSKEADGQPLPIQEMIQNIMKKLKSSDEFGRWVVIIDNVDDIHPEFETTVQTLSDFGSDTFLVVTSRRRDIYEGEVRLLEVKEMQLKNSMELVRKSLEITDNSSDDPISSLCEILGNFPLALNQAAAFIRQQKSSTLKGRAYKIQNYIEELTKNEKLGLDKDPKLGYSTATLKVWVITLNKIRECHGTEGQIALDLLDAMSFVNPDDIPIQFLHKLYQRFYTIQEIAMSQIKNSLTILLKYSLISSYDEVLSIHRLVQLALRDRMTSKSLTEDNESSKAVEILTKFWSSFYSSDWIKIEMRNILTIWNHTAKHKELNALRADRILQVQGQLQSLGMVKEAYEFNIEGCKFAHELYKPEDVEYWKMEFSLALALKEKGQYEPALQKLTSLYGKFEELLGAESEMTLIVSYWIALVLHDLEKFTESLEWSEKILQSQIRIYGEKNKDVMTTKRIVAMALQHLGRKEEAMAIYYEVLEWQEANLTANHPSIFATKHNIATCFFEEGAFAEALAISQEMLPHHEKIFGPDHQHTLTTKTVLAETLFLIGEMDQALKISEEVLVGREKVFGAEHPDTIRARERVTFVRKLNETEEDFNKLVHERVVSFKQLDETKKAKDPKPRKSITWVYGLI